VVAPDTTFQLRLILDELVAVADSVGAVRAAAPPPPGFPPPAGLPPPQPERDSKITTSIMIKKSLIDILFMSLSYLVKFYSVAAPN
jgi:hypothetical protein